MGRNADIYSMCGIAGIISLNKQLVTKDRLIKMTDAIMHRGPDGESQWINEESIVGLGHRRLSIIDLSNNASQPMHYLGHYTIVHNGEIYNYIEIRTTLTGKGYKFNSLSDTEVIVAAYDCWKEKCLDYFDGMFAFAIWDEKDQSLFAARDRFGEKPLYYYHDDKQLVFASEIKALWAAGVEKSVNKQLLYNFLTLGYTQNPGDSAETAYAKIYKLPAASFFKHYVNEKKDTGPVVYWQINKNNIDNNITEEAAIEKFSELFAGSITKRLRSDVPLGTSLSGGLDSSSIAEMIQRVQAKDFRLQTFSAVFPGSEADESHYIQLLAENKDIDNFTTHPSADDFINDFEKLCYHQEGLITSASVYAQYKVFQLAKQNNIKVLLDGQGADEVLAGYHKYYHWYWQELYKKDKTLLQKEIDAARELGVHDEWSWKNKLAAMFPAYAAWHLKNERLKTQSASAGIEKEFAASYGGSYYHMPQQDCLNNVLYYNTFNNGLEELLQYADRNSMAHGREVRLPFLNHQLVEFVFSLPSHFKIKNGRTKWVLRKAMDNLLPKEITWRNDKIGFEPPQKEWMRHPLTQQYISEAKIKLAAEGVIKKEILDKKIQPQDAHAADNYDWRYLVASKLF